MVYPPDYLSITPSNHNSWSLEIQSPEGYEAYAIDSSTIGIRPKWINVKDGLPSQFDHIIICDGLNVTSGYFQDGTFVGKNEEIGKVTHWMPLPEPPKE